MESVDDTWRLAALAACQVMDGPPRPHLDRIAELVVSITRAPVCLVSLVDDRRQFFAAQVGLGGRAADDRGTPLTQSLCRFVVISDEPLVVNDATVDPVLATHPAVTDLGVVAYCGVPIRDEDGLTLGSLCAIDTVPHAWTADDVAVLEALSEAVSAELHTDARYRRLTVDLHRRLLPARLPTGDRWQIGAAYRALETDVGLGGDLYDAIEADDGSLTLVVGDIVGHDADAAIAMGQLRAGTLALVHHGATLAEVATTLDRSCRSLPNVFCSAWVAARLDPSGRALSYLSAGAIPPLLLRRDGSAAYLPEASTPPIGVSGERYEAKVDVMPGDTVVLCSDGLVERRGSGLDVGLDDLAAAASAARDRDPQDLADHLMARRTSAPPVGDDIVVLVCRIA